MSVPALLLLIQTPAPGCNTHGRLYIAGFRDVANELGLRTTSYWTCAHLPQQGVEVMSAGENGMDAV